MNKYEMLSDNKYQNALNDLVDINYNGEDAQDIMEQARDCLQELVEKEKPKRVEKGFENKYDIDNGDYIDMQPSIVLDVYYCPNCSNIVYRKNVRCSDCGQKLDWRSKMNSLEALKEIQKALVRKKAPKEIGGSK